MRPIAYLLALGVAFTSADAADSGRESGHPLKTRLRYTTDDRHIGAPILGFSIGPAPNVLSEILGIPGAARWGQPLVLPHDVTKIRLGPSQGYALIERRPEGETSLLVLAGIDVDFGIEEGTGGIVPIAGTVGKADLVAFSPTGRTAALYSKAAGRMQVISGLPEAPHISRDVQIDAPLDRLGMAISDDGRALVLADPPGNVYLVSGEGHMIWLYDSQDVSDLTFMPGSHNLVICDRRSNRVVLLEGVTSGVSMRLLARDGDGIEQPDRAVVAPDKRSVLAASSKTNQIWRIDVASGIIRSFAVPVSPIGLIPLRNKNAFLFASPADEPASLVVWQGQESFELFVVPGVRNPRPKSVYKSERF